VIVVEHLVVQVGDRGTTTVPPRKGMHRLVLDELSEAEVLDERTLAMQPVGGGLGVDGARGRSLLTPPMGEVPA
jgi:hypothetical protein